ncbi:MAG: aldo/keto reductase [Deltaproteobacteria bacterium]|nr:aldo/keto reductase [Deltaproteobacteria bacterium]
MDKIKLILGTMTFGPQVTAEDSQTMVHRFFQAGYHELDTAYVYNEGETERILGLILKGTPEDSFVLGTKVNPRITGKLDANAVTMQFNESLRRLRRNTLDMLYFHFPDPHTPIEGALEACADLYERGKFKELGLSNFPAWMVVDIWHRCKEHGWPRPSVYQGLYNGLSRKAECELFPALRKLGMRFYAYNPLAGGLLTGKYSSYENSPSPGRFTFRPNYRNRYWKRSFFDAVYVLKTRCRQAEINLAEAAYRWLAYHSFLDQAEGDGIIIGASKLRHLEQNLTAIEKGPLPESIVSDFSAAWEEVKSESPDYFRCTSGSNVNGKK